MAKFSIIMEGIVLKRSFAAAAIGVPGAFAAHADIPAIVGIWTEMLFQLAKEANEPMTMEKALKIAGGIMVTIGGIKVGFKLANSYFAYTGIGTIPAILLNASANGVVTYFVGRSAGKVFASNGTKDSAEKIVLGVAGLFGISTLPGDIDLDNINLHKKA